MVTDFGIGRLDLAGTMALSDAAAQAAGVGRDAPPQARQSRLKNGGDSDGNDRDGGSACRAPRCPLPPGTLG
jgi:hypothetical protein